MGSEARHERLLGYPEIGDGGLLTREAAVEAAWVAVDPVLNTHPRALAYKRGGWGPIQADALMEADDSWHNSGFADAASD